MKQPKKLTRACKELMTKKTKFNPDNWSCLGEYPDGYRLINKATGKVLYLELNGKYRYENCKLRNEG